MHPPKLIHTFFFLIATATAVTNNPQILAGVLLLYLWLVCVLLTTTSLDLESGTLQQFASAIMDFIVEKDDKLKPIPEPPKTEVSWIDLCIEVAKAHGSQPFDRLSCPPELHALPDTEYFPPELVLIVEDSLDLTARNDVLLPSQTLEADDVGQRDTESQNDAEHRSPAPQAELPTVHELEDSNSESGHNSRLQTSSNAQSIASTVTVEAALLVSRASSDTSTTKNKPRSWLKAHFRQVKASVKGKEKASVGFFAMDNASHPDFRTDECISCFDDLPLNELVLLDCSHHYCKTCFVQLVTTSLGNGSQFPPKCCLSEIPLKTIVTSISPELLDVYREKAAEYRTPAGERWYCPSPTCSRFIPRKGFGSGLNSSFQRKCPYCNTKICALCRGAAHAIGQECPQDFGLEATLDFAEQEGWRRCIKCNAMVELTVGCRHMTCTCKAEFCYTCGAVWKTCRCTEVDEAARKARVREAKKARDREEREIAAAIAAIDEAVRQRETEQVRLEARRIQEEEEAAKRRAQEEERMRIEEQERGERHQRSVELSVNNRYLELVERLNQAHEYQWSMINKRHMTDAEGMVIDATRRSEKYSQDSVRLLGMLESNVSLRLDRLSSSHKSHIAELTRKHEEQGDETLLTLQFYLRGKTNREGRTEAMMKKLDEAQCLEMTELQNRLTQEMQDFKSRCKIERAALSMGLGIRKDVERAAEASDRKLFGERVAADRQWIEAVFRKRAEMLELWRTTTIKRGEIIRAESQDDEIHDHSGSRPAATDLQVPEVRITPDMVEMSAQKTAVIAGPSKNPEPAVVTELQGILNRPRPHLVETLSNKKASIDPDWIPPQWVPV